MKKERMKNMIYTNHCSKQAHCHKGKDKTIKKRQIGIAGFGPSRCRVDCMANH